MLSEEAAGDWFAVRSVFEFVYSDATYFEERVTLWLADSDEDAIALAKLEAEDYASSLQSCTPTGLYQSYSLGESPGHGAEVFSLIRASDLDVETYLDTYFDTGSERQRLL